MKENPKATFLAYHRFKISNAFKLFKTGKEADPLGYQVYCEFIGVDESKDHMYDEYMALVRKFPFFLRKIFLKFCETMMKRILKFRIIAIREISA